MSTIRTIANDLREKRLWPIVAALLAAVVAVPVLLSSNSSGSTLAVPPAPLGVPSTSGSAPNGVPAVAVTTAPSHARITGKAHNPFAQQHQTSTNASTATSPTGSSSAGTSTTTTPPASGTPSTSTTPASSTTPPSSSAPGTTTTPTTPTATIPTGTAPPAPPVLTASESYRVTISITNSSGGVDAIDPVQRLTVLPNTHRAMLVELGVLRGGQRVLFAVQPGTTVKGPGTCTPGPIDCQILALRPNQVESISSDSGSDQIVNLSSNSSDSSAPAPIRFAVTAIAAQDDGSAGAADQARRDESAAGRLLLNRSNADALSLFHYDPSVGALIDLRNVSVGGN